MSYLKNFLVNILLFTSFFGLFGASLSAYAQLPDGSKLCGNGPCPGGLDSNSVSQFQGEGGIFNLIIFIAYTLIFLASTVSVFFVVLGGYSYITSQGEKDKADKGRRTLVYASIGLTFCILSVTIVFILTRLVAGDFLQAGGGSDNTSQTNQTNTGSGSNPGTNQSFNNSVPATDNYDPKGTANTNLDGGTNTQDTNQITPNNPDGQQNSTSTQNPSSNTNTPSIQDNTINGNQNTLPIYDEDGYIILDPNVGDYEENLNQQNPDTIFPS